MRLAGAVALITGGSSGIGAATARALTRAGACPLIAGRDPARLREVARQTGAIPLRADLADPDGPDELAAAALAEAGRVDLLISNAGVGWAGEIDELTAAKSAELVAVNLLAPIHLARLLVPGMAKRGAGHIVFVSSIVGITGARHEAVYAGAKAGVGRFAESLSYELAGQHVGVSVVVPGVVDTPFFDRRGRPYNRSAPSPIPAERVARAIVTAVQRERDMVFVPGWMRFPAWLHGTAPRTFRALASRFG
ncbi:MAG TPA: SDR family NAD(P)-dependent oxidoreductase [Streptosporangiaceae bacterium]|jgi:short-subunit dehydrogenase